MKYDVFISYSSRNQDIANAICHVLEDAKIRCWIAPRDIQAGTKYASVIRRAIESCDVFVLVFSEFAAVSQWVESELNMAFSNHKVIVPYKVDNAVVEDYDEFYARLNNRHWIDSCPDFHERFNELVQVVSANLSVKSPSKPVEVPVETPTEVTEEELVEAPVEALVETPMEASAEVPQFNKAEESIVMCPCGSGKPFKDCHGKTNPLDLSTESQADESPNEPVETPVGAPPKTPADEPEEVPVVAPAYTPRSRNWKVGDYYNADGKEGVVFWVDQTGRYIKIVDMDQTKKKIEWCTLEERLRKVVAGAVDKYDGMKNCEAISKIADWESKYPSFAWCAKRGMGWYLPASEELMACIGDKRILEKVNATLKQRGGKILKDSLSGTWYWSSTEINDDQAQSGLVGRAVFNIGKSYDSYVRAVAMIDTAQESSTIWKVGDYYNVHGKEGIVFQVDETGKHGKIVSVDESYCRWSTVKQWWKGTATSATDKHDGMKNQQMIMEISDWHSKYPAFAWCAKHGPDWYLPAVEELKDLLLNREVYRMVDETLSRMKYKKINSGSDLPWNWSSTEFNGGRAFFISTLSKTIENTITESKCYVRAVSTF